MARADAAHAEPRALRRPVLRRAAKPHAVTTTVQLSLFVVVFTYAVFFRFLRPLGSAPLLIATAAAAFIAIVYARRYFEPILIAFAALGIAYVIASYAGVAHQGLTLMFDPNAIPQQAYYTLALPLLVPCFAYFSARLESGDRTFIRFEKALLIMCLLEQVLEIGLAEMSWSFLQSASNPDAIMAFIIARRLLAPGRQALALKWAILLMAALAVLNFQTTLVVALLAAIFIAKRFSATLLTGYVVLLITAAGLSILYAEPLWELDPNTGIRGFFWRDALGMIAATSGLGVGFGTESIRPDYYLGGSIQSVLPVEDVGFIHVGVHNAFLDAGYKMGILGIAITGFYFARLLVRTISCSKFTAFDRWSAGLLFTILMVNVGLASPNHLFAVSLITGWLVVRYRERRGAKVHAAAGRS